MNTYLREIVNQIANRLQVAVEVTHDAKRLCNGQTSLVLSADEQRDLRDQCNAILAATTWVRAEVENACEDHAPEN